MSGTITVNASLQVTNGAHVTATIGGANAIVQNGQGGGGPGFMDLAADTATTLDTTELTTEGLVYVKNLSTTITIDLGKDSTGFVVFLSLKPGEEFVFRLKAGITFQAKALSGSAKILVQVYED